MASWLRIQEALDLNERDLDPRAGALLVRRGQGRREVGMDDWGWEHLTSWTRVRLELPVGPLFCIIEGPTAGGRGRRPVRGPSCADSPQGRGCVAGSPRTSSVTRMRSRWRAKGCR